MTSYLKLKNGEKIAYNQTPGNSPGVLFLGGFRSDMNGVKAKALENYCKKTKRAFLRFDYEGHGESSGKFEDGTIGKWKDDAVMVLTKLTEGRQILVGSSMGGWLALHLAKEKPRRVAAVIGIAAAPDFTTTMLERMTKSQISQLQSKGKITLTSDAGEKYTLTRKFFEESRDQFLLEKKIPVHCPVRLIHGLKDEEVPWEISLLTNERLESEDVKTILVENGDHRLSEPDDIKKIISILDKTIDWIHIK